MFVHRTRTWKLLKSFTRSKTTCIITLQDNYRDIFDKHQHLTELKVYELKTKRINEKKREKILNTCSSIQVSHNFNQS